MEPTEYNSKEKSMDKELLKKYEAHLKKITKDNSPEERKLFLELGLEYINDLANFYKGTLFTPSDFEKIKSPFTNKEISQSITTELFNENKTSATAEEIFVYLITNSIDEMCFITKKEYLSSLEPEENQSIPLGYVDNRIKSLHIIKQDDKELEQHFINENSLYLYKSKFPFDIFADKYSIITKDTPKKSGFEFLKQCYKSAIYHELTHVFETEIYDKNSELNNSNIGIHVNFMHAIHFGHFDQIFARKYEGQEALFEMINEKLALNIADQLKPQFVRTMAGRRVTSNISLYGSCPYYRDLGLTYAFMYLLDDINFNKARFNDKLIEDKFNSYFTKSDVKNFQEKFKSYMENDCDPKNQPQKDLAKLNINKLAKEKYNLNKYLTLYNDPSMCDIFYTVFGCSDSKTSNNKLMAQEILLTAFKNKIKAQLDNPNIEKDENFFTKTDILMCMLDDVMSFPSCRIRLCSRFDASTNSEKGISYLAKDYMSYNDLKKFVTYVEKDLDADAKTDLSFIDQLMEIKTMVKEAAIEHNMYDQMVLLKKEKLKHDNMNRLKKENKIVVSAINNPDYLYSPQYFDTTKIDELNEVDIPSTRTKTLIDSVTNRDKELETKYLDKKQVDDENEKTKIKVSLKDSNGADRI